MSDYDEIPAVSAGKRCGVQWAPWMGDANVFARARCRRDSRGPVPAAVLHRCSDLRSLAGPAEADAYAAVATRTPRRTQQHRLTEEGRRRLPHRRPLPEKEPPTMTQPTESNTSHHVADDYRIENCPNERAAVIAGLRTLALMLAEHPDLPTPYSIRAQAGPTGDGEWADMRKVVVDAAEALGMPLDVDDEDTCSVRAELHHNRPHVAYVVHAMRPEVVDPSPAAAAAEVPADLALPRNPQGGLDLAALDAQVGLAPMTGAEALDAAATPEEWVSTALGVFNAMAARDEADHEDGAR